MFEKLLSNLPYNPSLVHQLGFYAKRMHREAAIRRTGMVFIVLSFFVQFFAVVAPPVATVAYSNNDMINGGVQTQGEAVKTCRDNTKNYGDVLADFGVSCADVSNASVTYIKSTDTNKAGDHLYSMGWLPEGKQNVEFTNLANVSETLYARRLDSFDTGPYSTYKVLKGTSHVTGKTFFIIFDCGNLVFFGVPVPIPQPKDVCPDKAGVQTTSQECDVCPDVSGIQTNTTQCDVCSNIAGVQTKATECDVCTNISGVQTKTSQCDVCPNLAGVQTKSSQCDVCSNLQGVQTSLTECDVCTSVAGVQTSVDQCTQIEHCPYNPSLTKDDVNCKPCEKAVSSTNALACIDISKTASDDTQGWTDANGKTATAGDVITYDLYAENVGKAVVPQFTMQENISDVLDYANVTDLHGGTQGNDGWVTWPAQDIPGGQKEHHQITVKIKDPIPQTPTDPGDQTHFDLTMSNTYGNTIEIHLPGSITKTIETTTTALPNTGPGNSLIAAGAIVVVAGYFFARTRLLAQESELAIKDTVSGSL